MKFSVERGGILRMTFLATGGRWSILYEILDMAGGWDILFSRGKVKYIISVNRSGGRGAKLYIFLAGGIADPTFDH